MNILLVEDYQHTRKTIAYGLRTRLGEIELAESDNGLAALNYIKAGNKAGIDAAKAIKEILPDVKIIMLTSFSDKKLVLSAFNAGANAYCMKNIKIDELVSVISSVLHGAIWIDPSIAQYILEVLNSSRVEESSEPKDNINAGFDLTARETEILKLVARGKSNKDIADELVLSIHTVKNHLKNILQKLCVEDRTQAAILAIKENLV